MPVVNGEVTRNRIQWPVRAPKLVPLTRAFNLEITTLIQTEQMSETTQFMSFAI